MGTRTLYVFGNIRRPACILFSNSSHESWEPEKVFKHEADQHKTMTRLVAAMCGHRYPMNSANGHHKAGDQVFVIDTEPGDFERFMHISHTDAGYSCIEISREEVDQLNLGWLE